MVIKNKNINFDKINIKGLKELKELGGGIYAVDKKEKIIDEVIILKNYDEVVRYCNKYCEGESALILSDNTYKFKNFYIVTEE